MVGDSLREASSSQYPQRGGNGRRIWPWAVGLPVLAASLSLVALLMLSPAGGSTEASAESGIASLQDRLFAAVLGTPTPTPVPTPTLTPSQIAGQFVPQLRQALSTANWDRSLELLSIMKGVDPTGEEVQRWSFTTRMQYGQALVKAGQEAQAQAQFDHAVALMRDDAEARLWQETTQLYLAGREAFAVSKWNAAIESFTLAYELIPDYSDLFARLVESYRRKGQAAIEKENWPVAIEALIEAYKRTGNDAPLRADVKALLLQAYRGQAQEFMANENWTSAIETLAEARERLGDDPEVLDLTATSYRQRGIARQDALKLREARADLKAALALRPGDAKAQSHLDRVVYLLSKRIVVDISEQRLYAYKNDRLVYKWPCSTGIRGRDTATGSFHILDKIPMAYSRIWRLRMPHWLGVYYVQGIENGIHALPIRPDGSVMWGGLLGQRASYGCIILSNQAAKKLYNWVDIGNEVTIRY